jgi:hypothetical protein
LASRSGSTEAPATAGRAGPEPPPTGTRPTLGAVHLAAYAAVLGLLELLLTVSVPAAAAGLGLLGFVTCLLLPAVRDDASVRLLPVLAAVPTVRLAVIAAPTADFAPVPRLALLAVPTLVAVVAAARAIPRPRRPLHPRSGGWLTQAALSSLGMPLGGLWYLVAPVGRNPVGGLTLLTSALLLAASVIPEELLHRGLLLPTCTDVAGRAGIPIAAAVYAAAFVGYGSVSVPATAFVTAVALGWCRQRTGSALGVVAARVVMVLVVYLALPAIVG